MPYVQPSYRYLIDDHLCEVHQHIQSPGDLNYAITTLCSEYLAIRGLRYSNINEVVGVLECAKMELYRRVAAPYEESKINENGDVYDESLVPVRLSTKEDDDD